LKKKPKTLKVIWDKNQVPNVSCSVS